MQAAAAATICIHQSEITARAFSLLKRSTRLVAVWRITSSVRGFWLPNAGTCWRFLLPFLWPIRIAPVGDELMAGSEITRWCLYSDSGKVNEIGFLSMRLSNTIWIRLLDDSIWISPSNDASYPVTTFVADFLPHEKRSNNHSFFKYIAEFQMVELYMTMHNRSPPFRGDPPKSWRNRLGYSIRLEPKNVMNSYEKGEQSNCCSSSRFPTTKVDDQRYCWITHCLPAT